MLKKILNSVDVKVLSRDEKIKIDGGLFFIDPSNVMFCRTSRDCSVNINGKCTCAGNRCVDGRHYCQ